MFRSVSGDSWKRPRKRRVRAIRDRLRELYGQPIGEPHGHPIAELVRTVLSQNTSDTNRDVAYARLRERFPLWEEVRDAPPEAVIEAIRPGGLANTKGPRIQAILREISNDVPDLDWLADAPRDEAVGFLVSLPGVGRKTAACVLMFALGRPEIPVDTHVHRVARRLGLVPAKATAEQADRLLHELVPAGLRTRLHVGLIRLGRQICKAPTPRCNVCPLKDICPTAPRYLSIGRP
jgi:endonuclease-3